MSLGLKRPTEGTGGGTGYAEVAPDTYEAFNEAPLTGDWELPNPEDYLEPSEMA